MTMHSLPFIHYHSLPFMHDHPFIHYLVSWMRRLCEQHTLLPLPETGQMYPPVHIHVHGHVHVHVHIHVYVHVYVHIRYHASTHAPTHTPTPTPTHTHTHTQDDRHIHPTHLLLPLHPQGATSSPSSSRQKRQALSPSASPPSPLPCVVLAYLELLSPPPPSSASSRNSSQYKSFWRLKNSESSASFRRSC